MSTTAIFSRHDGIVAWQCCTLAPDDPGKCIAVDAKHLSFGHHAGTLAWVAALLAERTR